MTQPQTAHCLRILALGLALVAPASPAALAASPPPYLNYQGVLRDAADNPLDDRYDMVFRFRSGTGAEILVDKHTTTEGGFVSVSGGLFNVTLGGGLVQDGTGPGTYTSLAQVFRDHDEVWLEIQVNGEVLSPMVRIHAAGYALNASYLGGRSAAEFVDTSSSTQTKTGQLFVVNSTVGETALHVEGEQYGALVMDLDDSGTVYLGRGDNGLEAYGSGLGGYFDSSGASGTGIFARGVTGGYFEQIDAPGTFTSIARFGYGIQARGQLAGGYFAPYAGSGAVTLGSGDLGIDATGSTGIDAKGSLVGGKFSHLGTATVDYALLGLAAHGIQAFGTQMAGYFKDSNNSGEAFVAVADIGVDGRGNSAGGVFFDLNESGYATVGTGHYGIVASGNTGGGSFQDSNSSGQASVGYGDRGIWAKGTFAGGTFSHPDNVTHWADVSTPTRKIVGTGTVSFVQNHPYDDDKVVVYAAPEGDEVAVYTRGSARMIDGRAEVSLGETFALVANPDIGLTAHVTPRGPAGGLHVEQVSTSRLVVAGPAGTDVEFDYLVYGLRIGFEEVGIVQAKRRDAFLPDPAEVAASHGGRADLRAHTALERFKRMDAATGRAHDPEMDAARALARRIDERRVVVLAEARATADTERNPSSAPERPVSTADPTHATVPWRTESEHADPQAPQVGIASRMAPTRAMHPEVPVTESVDAGDVLVLDSATPGSLRRAAGAFDLAVAGCTADLAEEPAARPGHARVATAGVVSCKVDAAFGAIAVGDLLTTSPTAGHAMRAGEYAEGAILGKAMEPLLEGTSTIRVIVTLR